MATFASLKEWCAAQDTKSAALVSENERLHERLRRIRELGADMPAEPKAPPKQEEKTRPTVCFMCNQDYRSVGTNAWTILIKQAYCGCQGNGYLCFEGGNLHDKTITDAPPRNISPASNKCYRCRK